MQLTREEQEQLAGLPSLPAYQLMMAVLREEESRLINQMRAMADESKLHSLVRFWQAVSRIIGLLETEPQIVAAELNRLKEERLIAEFDPNLDTFQALVHRIDPNLLKSYPRKETVSSLLPQDALADPEAV